MAMNRPDKPTATLPEDFGGVQTAYTESQIENGYLDGVPQVVDGGNMNYERKGLFQGMKYLRTVVDFIRDTPVGKIFWINQNGQMDYIEPAVIATDTEFNTGTATDKTPNVKQVVDKLATKSDDNSVVHKTGNETITGTKTFSNIIQGSINGNATTVTNGVYTSGNQTITGTKTFTGSVRLSYDTLLSKQDNGMEGGEIKFEKPTNSSLTGNANIDIYGNRMRFLGRNSSNNYTTPLFLDLETNISYATASDVTNSVVTTTGISKSGNGFVKLGNGIIIQWGRYDHGSNSAGFKATITLPTPFTNTNYSFSLVGTRQNDDDMTAAVNVEGRAKATTYINFQCSRVSGTSAGIRYIDWLAIGY